MPEEARDFRIGGVPFLVGAPLLEGLETLPGVSLRREVPSKLVTELRSGSIDCALVSSIEGFRTPGYWSPSGLGIASDGRVGSVRLFLRCPPSEVRSLALDRTSETSTVLTHLLLSRRYGVRPRTIADLEPTLRPDEVDADAVLLIGNAGLMADPGNRRTLDLGLEWKNWTGLPFVYALWLINGEESLARELTCLLREAWRLGKERGIDDGTGGLIQYELEPVHLEGLAAFRREAEAFELCRPGVEPRWISSG